MEVLTTVCLHYRFPWLTLEQNSSVVIPIFLKILIDVTVLLHFLFVLFVTFGALLCVKWPRLVYLHLPMSLWGAAVNIGQWACPLTYVERWLRRRTASPTYQRGFLERYITPFVYPRALDAVHFILLGIGLLLVNALVYGYLYRSGRLDPVVTSFQR